MSCTRYTYILDHPRLPRRLVLKTYARPWEIERIVNAIHWKIRYGLLDYNDLYYYYHDWPALMAPPRYYRPELIRRVPESLVRYYRTDPIEYPKITRRLYDTNVMQGRHTWLEVHVTGDPEPQVKWYKNSVPVRESESVKITRFGGGVHVLSIQDAIPSDEGLYTCTATNLVGEASTSALLFVHRYRNYYEPLRFNFYDRLYDL